MPHHEPPSGPDALGCFYALLTEKEGEASSRGWEDNFFLKINRFLKSFVNNI